MFQLVRFNSKMASLYQNVIYGKPDCWDVLSEHKTLQEAKTAAKNETGRVAIRLADDPQPNIMVSDFIRIRPDRYSEL